MAGRILDFATRLLLAAAGACLIQLSCHGITTITNTRAEISLMASLWEVDSIQLSSLANAQYPQFSNDWQYIFPRSSISADGDIHIDMAVSSSGSGSTNNNIGESPVIAEVVNATSKQLNQLLALKSTQAKPSGIFRFYTEHNAERHFEVHPATELLTWNGSGYVPNNYYRTNIAAVSDGTNHPASTLTNLLNGSQTITATVASDNVHVAFSYPSPSVNYVQYDGLAVSDFTNDTISAYFLLRPNLVPQVVVRCRIVTNTLAATIAQGVVSNQTVTVNALTRTDMLVVSNQIVALGANQSATFARPIELIVLGLTTSAQPPTIAAQPQSVTVNPGQDATFTVSALGTPPLCYQWLSNGVALASATNASLLLTNAQPDYAGSYSVLVTNAFGSVASSNASLVVVAGIIAQWNFNSTPPDTNTGTGSTLPSIGEGSLATVETSQTFFSGSTNDPANTGADNSGWSTSAYAAQGTGNKTRGAQFNVSTLGYQNVALSWEQRVSPTASKYFRLQYTTNGSDFLDSTNVITMLSTNVFEAKTNNLAAVPGVNNNSNFAFRIVAEFESSAMDTANSNYVTATGTGYTTAGTVRYDLVSVFGTAMPIITVQPRSEAVIVSSNVDFQVSAAGAPPLGYQWQFFATNLPGETNAILLLTNVSASQAGPYVVVVTNSVGSATSDVAWLTVYLTAAADLTLPAFSANQFQFNLTGVPGFSYAVQASSNLLDWTSVETNASPFLFTETNGYSRRFYRALYLPGAED